MVQHNGASGASDGAAPEPNQITLSTGVILRLRRVSTWAITAVERQMAAQRPQPPQIYNPDRDRHEPHEADPDYQAAVERFQMLLHERRFEVAVGTGTAIEHVPDGVPALENASWLELLAALRIPLPEPFTGAERYIAWVKYVAAPTDEDWLAITYPVRRQVGTPEEDVAAAAGSFRRNTQRGSN